METDKPIQGFFEDFDGEEVIGDVRRFTDGQDFKNQAQHYISETRLQEIPLSEPERTTIYIIDSIGEWRYEKVEGEGEPIEVYKSDIKYPF